VPKLPQLIEDRPVQRLINEVYEATARFTGSFTIPVKHRYYRGFYLGMSQIGKPCDRDIWYGFRGAPSKPKDGRMLQLFNVGDYIEQMQIFWLETAGYKITDRQASYKDHNGFFRGHPDGIIHGVTSAPHVWDAKSVNLKKFSAIKQFGVKHVYPGYYCQAQMMMHYSGTDRAIYTFVCKDNSEWYAERFYYNQTDAQALISRAKRIIVSNEIPPRPFEIDSFYCQWCDHRQACWYPEETIVTNQVCGTCHFCVFPAGTCKPWCSHPKHPFEIKTWGTGCPDWNDRFEKSGKSYERVPVRGDGKCSA